MFCPKEGAKPFNQAPKTVLNYGRIDILPFYSLNLSFSLFLRIKLEKKVGPQGLKKPSKARKSPQMDKIRDMPI
jgi:hypothetical protein